MNSVKWKAEKRTTERTNNRENKAVKNKITEK